MTHALDGAAICLVSTLGHSPAGEVFTLDALDVMGAVSRSLGADKLIIMSDFDGIESTDGKLQRQLTVDTARQILETADQGKKRHSYLRVMPVTRAYLDPTSLATHSTAVCLKSCIRMMVLAP